MNTKPCVCTTAALTLTLLLGLGLYGCPTEAVDDSGSLPVTEGRFTLTGLDGHNGKYAFIREKSNSTGNFLFGMADVVETNIIKGVEISDGTAEIPLYLYYTSEGTLGAFEESDNFLAVSVFISAQEECVETEVVKIQTHCTFSNVQFDGGSVTKDRSEGYGL
jgi:hypothetical protein